MAYQPIRETPTEKISKEHAVFHYRRGQESQLQKALGGLNTKQDLLIVVVTSPGPDSDAATGLVQTLDHEFAFWRVRLLIFEDFDKQFELGVDPYLPVLEKENILFVSTDGSTHVPRLVAVERIVESNAPAAPVKDEGILDDDHIAIQVVKERKCMGIVGFFGRVRESRSEEVSSGDPVAGICFKPKFTNGILSVPESTIIATNRIQDASCLDPLAVILVALVVWFSKLSSLPENHSNVHVLLALSDESLTKVTSEYLSSIRRLEISTIGKEDRKKFNFVLTDSISALRSSHLQRYVARGGKIIVWDSEAQALLREGYYSFKSSFSLVYDYLLPPRRLIANPTLGGSTYANDQGSHELTNGMTGHAQLSVSPKISTLFRDDRAYLLTGGVSTLGADMAIWMYEVNNSLWFNHT